jgi:hypothetical protein
MTTPPSGPELLEYVRNQIVLHPEKYGVMGSYSMEMLQAQRSEDAMLMFDQLAFRLTTLVLSGQTVSEHPEVTFTYYTPDTWWDHVKKALWDWRDKQNRRWEGTGYDGQPDTPPPWMILLWPFLVLFPKWGRRYPPRTTPKIVKTTVNFRQAVLYPETNHIPSEFGRPVIYETMDAGAGFGLVPGSSRFLNRHEIASAFYGDPEVNRYISSPNYGPDAVLRWLERQGVNVDQLVKRR